MESLQRAGGTGIIRPGEEVAEEEGRGCHAA